jgi:hypothetical protein
VVSKNEKSFQNYFMKIAKPLNYYRTSLTSGSGYPDVTGFHGDRYSLVELKHIVLGKRGNKKLSSIFQDTQPPWYLNYFANGGTRLFVAWKVEDFDGSNKRYGLWKLTKHDVLTLDVIHYQDLATYKQYREFSSCKEMVESISEQ